MAEKQTIIQNEADPKGREVFLIQHGQKYRVEKPATGYQSAFVGLEKAKEYFKNAVENSNF